MPLSSRAALLSAALACALLLAGGPAGSARADEEPVPPATSESLAVHRLKALAERQRSLFADTGAQGDKLDGADIKARVQMLVHDYESLLADNPDFVPGYTAYGYFLWRVGMRAEAVGILLKADSLEPDIPLVKNELGNFLAEEGRPLEAIGYFQAASGLAPDEPLYHFQVAQLLNEGGDDFVGHAGWTRDSVDRTLQAEYRRAAELEPARIEYAYNYGMSFYRVAHPDWNAALALWRGLEAGAQSEPERETMLVHEANVLIHLGRRAEAVQVLAGVTLPGFREKGRALLAPAAPATTGGAPGGAAAPGGGGK